ncbi:hypothetical protein, partial [Escherichia coli]|uniref:hypothetical protein n=1 Tax=Escherichia coli TaxID=562 RepID=UPI0029317A24
MSLIPLRGASKFYIHKSIELMEGAQELRTYPWVYVRAMNFYISSGELPDVEQLVDKTMKYLTEIGDDFTYGDKLGLNGYRLLFEGKFQESLQEFGILLDVTNRNHYLSHHAIALYGHTMATLNFG